MIYKVGDEVTVAGSQFTILEVDWLVPNAPIYKLSDTTWVNQAAINRMLVDSSPLSTVQQKPDFCQCGAKFERGFENLHMDYCPVKA